MDTNFTKNSDAEMKRYAQETIDEIYASEADVNKVMQLAPLVQMAQNELTGRYVRRTTIIAIGVAILSLFVSVASLYVAYKVGLK